MTQQIPGALLAVAAVLLAAAPARAQDVAARAASPRQVVSLQPLQLVAGVAAGDYERRLGGGITLGIGASYWDAALSDLGSGLDARYVSSEGKLRWYLGGTPFRGFSLGGTVGVAHASADVRELDLRGSATGVKVGVETDYNWLFGRRQRMAAALGVGAKRIFYGAAGERFVRSYPTSRIALGWAF